MDVFLILLLQVLIYAAFPFYFVSLPSHLRSVAFYIYLAVLYVFGGFLGSLYSLPLSESILISGGNLNYGAFMMTIILLVIIERDLDIVRHILRLIVVVNVFKLLMYSSLSWALGSPAVINSFETSTSVFSLSIPFVVLGGSLIIFELLIFLLIFSFVKRWIKNIFTLALLYTAFYLFILLLDGILFPLLAFATNPALVDIIYGGVSGKLMIGGLYAIPMLVFIGMNRQHFLAFVAKDIDLSELMKASRYALQAALKDSERRYRLLVDSSPYAIAIYQHNKIVFANQAACELIGVADYQAMLGQSFFSFVPAEEQKQRLQELQQFFQAEGEYRTVEQEILRADGSRIPVEITAVWINYQGQAAIQIIARDIRERRAAEIAAQKANRLQIELEKQRELAELKMRFTSMLVHDFRNPVASINLASDVIQRHAQAGNIEKIGEKASRIALIARQLDGQIDSLLELGKAESALLNFAPKVQDIVEFCREVFTSFEQIHESTSHDYQFTSELEHLSFNFDNHLMERVIDNLLSNAVKYSPNGGKVEMKIRQIANTLEIVVSDNGLGIPEEDLARIFDFFQRASNASAIQGTGVGLAIVKQIIEKHGGTIRCESEIQKGSCFTINLPMENQV